MMSGWSKNALRLLSIAVGGILSGCGEVDESVIYSKKRKGKAHFKPYQIKGVWYHPQSHYCLEEEGIASYYGINDNEHEGPDAMGGVYNMHKMTAAHKTLPLPSIVEVHNLHNGKRALVAVTDRGPFVDGRVIDVSVQAAKALGFFGKGITPVRIKALEQESKVFAQLSQNVCLKSCNLSDLLPKVIEVCQNAPKGDSIIYEVAPKKMLMAQISAIPAQKLVPKSALDTPLVAQKASPTLSKLYVSVNNLSFDQAMWVRVQSVASKWGHPRLKKQNALGLKPFMTLVGPFLSPFDAKKAMNFFAKNKMSAVVLSLS